MNIASSTTIVFATLSIAFYVALCLIMFVVSLDNDDFIIPAVAMFIIGVIAAVACSEYCGEAQHAVADHAVKTLTGKGTAADPLTLTCPLPPVENAP